MEGRWPGETSAPPSPGASGLEEAGLSPGG